MIGNMREGGEERQYEREEIRREISRGITSVSTCYDK